MESNKTKYALAALLSLSISSTASASLFDFNASNLGVTGSYSYYSVGMLVDGIDVDITAHTIQNNGSGVISTTTPITGSNVGVYVSSSSNNIGVVSRAGEGSKLDGGNSGNGPLDPDPDEGLLFSFDQVVSLEYINFDSFGSDDFNLTVDGVSVLTDFNGISSSSSYSSVWATDSDKFDFTNVFGQNFLFWADGNSDSFRIDDMIVSAVPVPASLLLIATGLMGLSFSRRYKKPA